GAVVFGVISIRLHRKVGFILVLFSFLADFLTPVLYQSGAFLFQKSLRVRREVLGYPTRITSKISAPLFGARAKLALLHWVAAMGFPVAFALIEGHPISHPWLLSRCIEHHRAEAVSNAH